MNERMLEALARQYKYDAEMESLLALREKSLAEFNSLPPLTRVKAGHYLAAKEAAKAGVKPMKARIERK